MSIQYPDPDKNLGIQPINNIEEAEIMLIKLQGESSKIQAQLTDQDMVRQKGSNWRKKAITARTIIDRQIIYVKGYIKFYNINHAKRNNLSNQAFKLLIQIFDEVENKESFFNQDEINLIGEIKQLVRESEAAKRLK